jgi:hypothetical protein
MLKQHDPEVCEKIFVRWTWANGIMAGCFGLAIIVAYSFGTILANTDNKIINQETRIQMVEKTLEQSRVNEINIINKLDTLIQISSADKKRIAIR